MTKKPSSPKNAGPKRPRRFVVRGQVRRAGRPLVDVAVELYEQRVSDRKLLGKCVTDDVGRYERHYTEDDLSRQGQQGALVVSVVDGKGHVLVESAVIFNARPEETVDLAIGEGRGLQSEYDRLVESVTPVLGDVPRHAIADAEATFLSGQTGWDAQYISWLGDSARRHREADAIPESIFYGLFRQRMPTAIPDLVAGELLILREMLERSSQTSIIPFLSNEELDQAIERLRSLKADLTLKPATSGRASLGDLLNTARLSAEKQRTVAELQADHDGASEGFWNALAERAEFNPTEQDAIRLALQLGDLTGHHLPLIAELQRRAAAAGAGTHAAKSKAPVQQDMRGVEAPLPDLRSLAAMGVSDWKAILQRPQPNGQPIGAPPATPGGTEEERLTKYAETLYRHVEEAVPTLVIANRAAKDSGRDSPFKEVGADLQTFFARNPAFDFRTSPVDAYLRDGREEKLKDVADPRALTAVVRKVGRVFKVAPRYDDIRTLLADDLHSALSIVRVGERTFTERYEDPLGGKARARDIYLRAKQVHTLALTLFFRYSMASRWPEPYGIGGAGRDGGESQPPVAGETSAEDPDWSTLFGSLDLCDCDHCKSLYGPAAYFVDIMRFLADGPLKDGRTPLQMLLAPNLERRPDFERRPDLEHIELTCENTTTQLPYVDLANEILEAAIAPRSFEIPDGPAVATVLADLRNGKVPASFPAAFAAEGFALTDEASVRTDSSATAGAGSGWVVLDRGWAFTMKYQGHFEGFRVFAWPQTSWTSDELRATPEHTHNGAYTVLRDAVYPGNLPLNLPVEEMRVYLRHLGVPRHELMETLFPGTPVNAWANPAIAHEHLGLTPKEADIITGVTTGAPAGTTATSGAWNFWGLEPAVTQLMDPADRSMQPVSGDWDVVLRRVSIFLHQSSLRYDELLELLGSYYLNPGSGTSRLLGLRPTGENPSTCAPSQLEIGLTDRTLSASVQKTALLAVWHRTQRFVRLWRALRWTVRDLDKAITAFAPTNANGEPDITPGFLIQLSHVERLRAELGLDVPTLLSWWALIDTGVYFDHLKDGAPSVPSLYGSLFDNRSVTGQSLGSLPFAPADTLSSRAAVIAAALQLSADDLARLRGDANVLPRLVGGGLDDRLNLENLSSLHRHAALARALKIGIREYQSLLQLVSVAPFSTTVETLRVVRQVALIRASGFTIEDLDYLLRHQFTTGSPVAITDDEIAVLLDSLRVDLRAVDAENTFVDAATDADGATSDPSGDVLRAKLALLNWDSAVIDQVVGALNDTFTYRTNLTALAAGIVVPDALKNRLTYDAVDRQLRFTGAMFAGERTLLTNLQNADAGFVTAVGELFAAPRAVVSRYMRRFSVPLCAAPLDPFPANVKIPDALKGKCYYDAVEKKLRFVGVMTDAERALLLKASADPDYATAIGVLYAVPVNSAAAAADAFLTSADAATLFDNPATTSQARFLLALRQLLPHLRATLSERVVIGHLAEYLHLDASAVGALLTKWLSSPVQAAERAMADFVAPTFADSNANVQASSDAFPEQFETVVLLHKIASLSTKFRFTTRQLEWLFEPGSAEWLDFRALPLLAVGAAHSSYKGWARLVELSRLRDALPGGEDLLTEIFTMAAETGTQVDDLLETLRVGTRWDLANLQALSGAGGFVFTTDDFKTEAAMLRLADAYAALKRLGASADLAFKLADVGLAPDAARDAARDARSLVRAKVDAAQWLEAAKSLHDPLRERKRAALVSYVVHQKRLHGADELYEHLLIDVEMSPCMMTTRIKQAISSVQLFVQRALMSLEDDVALTPAEAREWSQWRKQYRVWEANRKVLLYPENWIEPELRDDKSVFFEELEDELLQSDVTADTAEQVFLHYLEKLDQVARLDVVGMYREIDSFGSEILHVVGRTHATPGIYFYRRLEAGVWSTWTRVDLDIEGDHVMPIVWNRRLHVFWASFTEKTDPLTKKQRGKDADPVKKWEIKIAWSQFKNGKWAPKKISRDALYHVKHPAAAIPQEPPDFSFKTRIQQGPAGEQLSLECYGTWIGEPPPPPAAAPVDKSHTVLFATLAPGTAFGNPIATRAKFALTNNGVSLRPLETKKTSIRVEGQKPGSQFNETIALAKDGTAVTSDFAETVNCYLISEEFDFAGLDTFIFVVPLKIGLGLSVDLAPWTAPVPATDATYEPALPPYLEMQAIGEFTLDDQHGSLVATDAARVPYAIDPYSLDPIAGTKVRAMALVETNNPADTLGRDAVLRQTPGAPFRVLLAHQGYTPHKFTFPFFFQDEKRTYFVFLQPASGGGIAGTGVKLRFSTFFHPRVGALMRSLGRRGVEGLLTLENQRLTDDGSEFLKYTPNYTFVDNSLPESLPREDVDFTRGGAYAAYNWEVFFHAPFLIAIQLSHNQRFEEAQKWFHYIFDPRATDSPDRPGNPGRERFWRVKPLYEEALKGPSTLEDLLRDGTELAEQVKVWSADPFKPHAIARLRPAAYMKAVVMRYIDNLIAWGDQLFRRETIESINEATQLYVLAAELLGKRPDRLPARAKPKAQTFRTLDDEAPLDVLSNAVVAVEGFLGPSLPPGPVGDEAPNGAPLTMPFFCLTANDKLLGYWDTVADRLFKIRHCMNIEGVVRTLAIFEPPIDPALLVRAAAAGVDLSSVLADVNAPLPPYRFSVMLQKASELCNEVQALGGALLAALEKRDAEALALLRSSHEVELLKAVRFVKQQQVDEATNNLLGLIKYQDVVTARQQYYLTRPFLNPFERVQLGLSKASLNPMATQLGAEVIAGVLHLIPNVKGGAPTTLGLTYGGANIATAVQAFGSAAGTVASMLNTAASLSGTLGTHQRRQDDWTHQADLATKELEQVKKQIAAAGIRAAIADHDLQNHDLQTDHAKEAHDFMRYKFTNRELYNWMVGRIAGIYFQSYQLAYDVAKRAERAYRHELGLKDSNFVQFGHWDSLKKGLLAGERLRHDLRRMDVAYLDQNRREYEITKHISLNALDPVSVIRLKQIGDCFINLPEALFDVDHPGHYLRRLKSVGVTIPCVAGPYASVNCTLTQHNSTVRLRNTLASGFYARQPDDARFADSIGAVQSIVTSGAQNDSGLFETNLRDERYLPFEGQGAVSAWRLELPKDFPTFDHDTISDVILHLRYTAREGGESLRRQAGTELTGLVNAAVLSAEQAGLARSFSLRHEFPSDWYRFLNPPAGAAGDQSMRVDIDKTRFPFLLQSRTITIGRVNVFVKVKQGFTTAYNANTLKVSLQPGTTAAVALTLTPWNGLLRGERAAGPLGDWTLTGWRDIGNGTHLRVDPQAIEDVVIVCAYTVSGP